MRAMQLADINVIDAKRFEVSSVHKVPFLYAICRLKENLLLHANSKLHKTNLRPKDNTELT